MKSLKELFIASVVEEVVNTRGPEATVRIMDLGCGTASYVPELLRQFPTVEYVGVEPIDSSYQAALKNLAGVERAVVHFQLGYDNVEGESEASFDLVFSLSVLEHIKQLERFLALGARYLKVGGVMMHRYDLGHALYPHNLRAMMHVLAGNLAPKLLPERQFVRYVPESEVRALYERCGVSWSKTTYHQMPNHKVLEKHYRDTSTAITKDLFDWEMKYQAEFLTMPVASREKLFPAVAVWGVKR